MAADAAPRVRGRRWLWHAIRSRIPVNLLLLAVAAVAVLAAVLGPLLVRAMVQFTVQESVERAGADQTAIQVSLEFNGEDTALFLQSARDVLATAAADGRDRLWAPAQVWTESSSNVAWARSGTTDTEIVAKVRLAGADCEGMIFTAGRCPTDLREVVLAKTNADQAGIGIGSSITLRPPSTTTGERTPPADLTVVGLYDPENSGVPRTRAGESGDTTATGSPLVVSTRQAAVLSLPVQILGRLDLRSGLRAEDEADARAAVAAVDAAVLQQVRNVDVSTGLIDLLDRVGVQTRSATILVAVTEIQALALAVFALAVVLQRIAVTRAAEWGIGRLRGVPRRRWYISIYAEPALALVVGCVLGFFAGLIVAQLSVRATLGSGIAIEPGRWPVISAGLAVLVAFLVALVAVSLPSLRLPLVELIQQRSENRKLGIVGAVSQSAIVLLAAAAIYQLQVGGVLNSGGSQLGLLAPALLALTLAIAAVRLAVILVGRVTAKAPRSLVGLIVGRQAARTPSSLNPAVVVSVGMALAIFATQLAVVSVRNQGLRATAIIGAQTVLQVDVPPGEDLRTLVDAADPTGRYAMAAQERRTTSDTGVTRILAVDTTRYAAVSISALPQADLTALHPAVGEPVTVQGKTIEVSLSDVSVKTGVVSVEGTPPADPHLLMILDTAGGWQPVDLGTMTAPGPLRADIPCLAGCRLVGFGTRSDAGAAYTTEYTISSVSTDQQSADDWAQWLAAGGWHARVGNQLTASPRDRAQPNPGPGGIRVTALDEDGGNVALILPPDTVDPLPALVAPNTGAQPFAGIPNAVLGRSLDGQSQLLVSIGQPAYLPRLLTEGVLVDLELAGKLADPAAGVRADTVWLAADAPPTIEAALADQGLTVTSRELLSERSQDLQEQPSTRAAVSARYLGLAALVLTLLALIAALVADVSRRRPDWKSLLDGGLAPRTVFRLAYVEIGLPVVIGTLLGAASGVAGFALAAAKLPLVDLTSPGPPLDLAIPWSPVITLTVVVLVVVVIIAGVAARWQTRRRRDSAA